MKKIILTTLVATACALLSQQAYADSIGFFGASSASGDSSKSSPTTVSFTNPWTVVASNGIFTGSNGASATMSAYTFTGDGATAVCTSCPQTQWVYSSGGTTYTFTLNSLSTAATRPTSIAAQGLGTVTLTGAQTGTFGGSWSMSGSGSGFKYSFSFITTTVPDGGSAVALLGIALTGIEAGRRLIRARKA